MLPPPVLIARGPIFAALVGLSTIALHGFFWVDAQKAKVDCRGAEATVDKCTASLFTAVSTALLCVASIQFFALAVVAPTPKLRRTVGTSYHQLSTEFTHVGFTHPDDSGYHHILYVNHPTTPSKVRFNMAQPGIHKSEIANHNLNDHLQLTKRSGTGQDWFVDISRDDQMPPAFNDFKPADVLELSNNLMLHMIDYFATNSINGSCFLTQYQGQGRSIRQAILKIVPSLTGNGGEDFPALECGSDLSAFGVNIPLY